MSKWSNEKPTYNAAITVTYQDGVVDILSNNEHDAHFEYAITMDAKLRYVFRNLWIF